MTSPNADQSQSGAGEVARLVARLGFIAFGGPAAHISMMHDEVVTRRRWLDDQRFLDLIGVTNLIPGPNSTEMAMHVDHERAGWRGLALIVLGFAWVDVVLFGLGDRPDLRCVSHQRHVAGDHPTSDGAVECTADDETDL